MPLDEDKYPGETGRRRFVKGVVGAAALASVGTGSAAALNSATSPSGAGGGPTQYVGIENTDGPAPRSMPVIPVEVTGDGELRGVWPEVSEEDVGGQTVQVAETDMGGITYSSSWLQYCGVQQYAGTQPDADQDNLFRSTGSPDYAWQGEAASGGDPLTVDMFDDYEEWGNGIGRDGIGKPADAQWRSEGDDVTTIPIQVIRSSEVSAMANGEQGQMGDYSALPGAVRSFISAATDQDFLAWLNKCTHFCCVPGYKDNESSADFGGENGVYSQCHQSIYDPYSPVQEQFIALPRPEGDDG